MLGPVQPTEFDLRFSLFGIPVRVAPWFWLMAAILGWELLSVDAVLFVLWILVVFLSILVHEFGHALTAQAFSYQPHILLYQFGGLAMYQPYRDYTTARQMLITAAGPGAGFALYGVVWLIAWGLVRQGIGIDFHLEFLLSQLLYVNLWWSILNLAPVLPLDGGRLCQSVLIHFRPRDGVRLALMVSIATAAAIAAYFFLQDVTFTAVFFALLAAGSFSELQERRY